MGRHTESVYLSQSTVGLVVNLAANRVELSVDYRCSTELQAFEDTLLCKKIEKKSSTTTTAT